MPSDDFIVTPWNVEGDIDYEKLIKRFGTEKITPELISKIDKFTNESHYMLRRGIFFSHREFNRILDDYEKFIRDVVETGLFDIIWLHDGSAGTDTIYNLRKEFPGLIFLSPLCVDQLIFLFWLKN